MQIFLVNFEFEKTVISNKSLQIEIEENSAFREEMRSKIRLTSLI